MGVNITLPFSSMTLVLSGTERIRLEERNHAPRPDVPLANSSQLRFPKINQIDSRQGAGLTTLR